jgi:hypothetical protein
VAQQSGSKSFTLGAGVGTYAPERLNLCKASQNEAYQNLIGVTALIESGVATAVLELWLLKRGGDPTNDAHFFNTGKSLTASGAETWPLASWDGAQLRAKSGGTAGSLVVSATAD